MPYIWVCVGKYILGPDKVDTIQNQKLFSKMVAHALIENSQEIFDVLDCYFVFVNR